MIKSRFLLISLILFPFFSKASQLPIDSLKQLFKQQSTQNGRKEVIHLLNEAIEEYGWTPTNPYLDLIADLINSNNNPEERAELLLFYSHQQINQGALSSGTSLIFQAIPTYEQLGNWEKVAVLYNNLGAIFEKLEDHRSSIQYTKKSLQIYEQKVKVKKMNLFISSYINMGSAYHKLDSIKLAKIYLSKALQAGAELPKQKAMALHNLGEIAMDENDLEKAKNYFEQSLSLKLQTGDQHLAFSDYIGMARYYLIKEEYAQSEQFYTMADSLNKINPNPAQLSSLHFFLYHFYLQKSDYKKALRNLEAYNLNQELYGGNKMRKEILNLVSKYEKTILAREQERIIRQRENQIQYYTYLSIVSILFSILLLALIYLWKKNKSAELKILKIENQGIKTRMEYINNELRRNMTFLIQLNEISISATKKLLKLKLSLKNEYRKELSNIIADLQNMHHEDAWKNFNIKFDVLNQNFFFLLEQKYGTFTPNEKKLAALLKMNMNSKEISSVTGQSIRAIEVARSRLRKKLNIDNTDIPLNNFLQKFEANTPVEEAYS
ncbi:tetratricopeptide repeat protein [Persicobacter diffluens]|uniref:HTH luxR-type domain-containing protein n=1 Tax=Persicobacter diffluens TaxID=981 RepID=A0AAN4W1J4_9BACT|nr:hypothetical protein PEDI_35680 [Persicobacter diffluens]